MSGRTDQAPKADTTGSSFPDDVSVNGAATLEPGRPVVRPHSRTG